MVEQKGLRDGSPTAETRGMAVVGVWGRNIVPIKTGFCVSSVCMLLLKHALKLKRHTDMQPDRQRWLL